MLKKSYPYYLANKPVAANTDLEVLDKYSGKRATRVAFADAAVVRKAIVAAHKAREAMAAFPPDARRDVLEHCVRRFSERSEELALALCIEAGKPIHDARGEVERLIDTFRIAAGEATRIDGEIIELQISKRTRGYRGMIKHVPIGPCAFITPFNFPLNLVAHKVAPAIAAGCPFVLKPAPKTPIGALIIGEVLAETDLPKGAFSILPCSNEDAGLLVEDERIALLSFTGGLVGWDLKARAGRKKVTLELGGNAACIIDADPGASLDHVVDRLVFGAYYQSGQSCISVQRIYAHAEIHDRLRRKLKAAVGKLRMGDPRDEHGVHRPDDRRGGGDAGRKLDRGGGERRREADRRRQAPGQHAAGGPAGKRAAFERPVSQGSLWPGGDARSLRRFRRRHRAHQRQRLRPAGRGIHRHPRPRAACLGPARSRRRDRRRRAEFPRRQHAVWRDQAVRARPGGRAPRDPGHDRATLAGDPRLEPDNLRRRLPAFDEHRPPASHAVQQCQRATEARIAARAS